MAFDLQQGVPMPGGPMSEEEYLYLDRSTPHARYEYVDGVARLMSGGSGEHDQISYNVRSAIGIHLQSGPCFARGSDMQVLVGTKSNGRRHYVYPDVTVSCDVSDRRRGNKLIESPRIVVEVLSPSTERDDRGPKLKAYKLCPSIQEILLISQFAPHVEVYRRNGEDGATWSYSQYGPGESFLLESIDVPLTMDEIYRSINFDEPLLEDEQ
jgi:Uma2 family endonuclease